MSLVLVHLVICPGNGTTSTLSSSRQEREREREKERQIKKVNINRLQVCNERSKRRKTS